MGVANIINESNSLFDSLNYAGNFTSKKVIALAQKIAQCVKTVFDVFIIQFESKESKAFYYLVNHRYIAVKASDEEYAVHELLKAIKCGDIDSFNSILRDCKNNYPQNYYAICSACIEFAKSCSAGNTSDMLYKLNKEIYGISQRDRTAFSPTIEVEQESKCCSSTMKKILGFSFLFLLFVSPAAYFLYQNKSSTPDQTAGDSGDSKATPSKPLSPVQPAGGVSGDSKATPSEPLIPVQPAGISGKSKVTLFTSYTIDNPERLEMSRMVAANQRQYCEKLGCEYVVFEENLAAPSLPYWSKIKGILQLWKKNTPDEWIVWIDDDAIITNPSIDLLEFINSHGGSDPNTDVIVTQDSRSAESWCTAVNTGILIVRKSYFSYSFFSKLWRMRDDPVRGYTYGTCPNQKCLHEQQAMHDLLRSDHEYFKHVRIIPQRDERGIGFNVFQRFNHYDVQRDMYLDYDGDPSSTRFRRGDFIAQCTGLATVGVPASMRGIAESEGSGNLQTTNFRFECVKDLIRESKKAVSSLFS